MGRASPRIPIPREGHLATNKNATAGTEPDQRPGSMRSSLEKTNWRAISGSAFRSAKEDLGTRRRETLRPLSNAVCSTGGYNTSDPRAREDLRTRRQEKPLERGVLP